MPGGPCSRREPSSTDISRVGLPSMPRMKSPVRKPGPRGRRAVARGDDAQVVLAGQLEADVALRRRPCAGEGRDLGGREIRAVGIEPLGQAVHRALHDAVAVHRFDVAAEDERHHFLEDAHRPVGLVARRGCLAHEPAGHDQQHDRRGDEQQDETGSRAHSLGHFASRRPGRPTHDEHLPGRYSRTSTGADSRGRAPLALFAHCISVRDVPPRRTAAEWTARRERSGIITPCESLAWISGSSGSAWRSAIHRARWHVRCAPSSAGASDAAAAAAPRGGHRRTGCG